MNDERRPAKSAVANSVTAEDSTGCGVRRASPPAVVIELRLEGPVRVYSTATCEEEHLRALDWVSANVGRRRLLDLALEMRDEANTV
jgi:hypothetical protein